MKVMYLACNPESAETLMVEAEITALQANFLRAGGGDNVSLATFPKLSIEQLPLEIARHRPEVSELEYTARRLIRLTTLNPVAGVGEVGIPIRRHFNIWSAFRSSDRDPAFLKAGVGRFPST